jgi:hypothetical protein
VAIRVVDVTQIGIQLDVSMPIPSGEDVEVELVPPDGGRPVKTTGFVVGCIAVGNHHSLRVCFRRRMGYGDLLRIGRVYEPDRPRVAG